MTSTTMEKPKKTFDRRSVRYRELKKAHNYIKWHDDRGKWPTHAQIAKHMGTSDVCDLLTDMVLAGMVVRVPIKGRKQYKYTVIR